MRLNKLCCKSLLLAGLLTGCMGMNAYAAEYMPAGRELKEEVAELLEKQRDRGDEFSVAFYNLDDLYAIETQTLMINAYREGQSMPKMLEESASETKQRTGGNVRTWRIKYQNTRGENCIADFREVDGELTLVGGKMDEDFDRDMKVTEDKFPGINQDEIEEIRYINFDLYRMEGTYLRMKDGTEFMIPYGSDRAMETSHLQRQKIYKLDGFMETMYNYYDEPTTEEVKEIQARAKAGDMSVSGRTNLVREEPLNQKEVQVRVLQQMIGYGSIGVVGLVGLFGCIFQSIRKKKHVS